MTVCDGNLSVRKAIVLRNLSGVIVDKDFHKNLVDVDKVKESKAQFMEALKVCDFKGYVYLDCLIGAVHHDAVFVGDFGLAARHDADNPVFKDLKNVYSLPTLVEICRLKASIFVKCTGRYKAIIEHNLHEPSVLELVDDAWEMDRDAFVASELWRNIKDCRAIVSQRSNLEPSMLFTVNQAFEFLSQFPTGVCESSVLDKATQELLLSQWKLFLEKE